MAEIAEIGAEIASRPTRARGLKHAKYKAQIEAEKSRPTRARGLKLTLSPIHRPLELGRAPRGRVD